MKILTKLKKFISIMTASCLLISFVIGPTAANAMTNEEATAKYKQIFKDFMLPYNYGQITSAHYAGTDRVIINIQDLHCHPKVQKNISNIIETFDKSYDVKKIYLEGVYGQISTRWITDRMDNMKRATVLDKMVETGRLTGAEYYSAISGKTEIIKGLEEKGPYLENLKRFGNIIENQDKIQLIIQSIDESVSKLKEEYYTKRQYKLDELSKKYLAGEISPQKYYALLAKHIEKLGIDLSEYENTFTYVLMLEMQKNLDYSKITTELQNLILMLKENLANSAYQMLVDNTENFSKIDKLYGYIVRISRELNLDLTVNFPNLDNYFSYIEFSQKINPLELINEEKKLTQEINTRFSETKAQREVVFLINFERYLKDYVTSKITADDYEYYKENIAQYRQLWNKYVDNKVLSLLDNYIAEADKFYKINTDRNIYFTRNMFNENDELHKIETKVQAKGDVNKIIENMKGVKEVDIVITGGFHSQTVTEILKNHDVSYIVITPNVTDGTKLAEDTYYEIAKEQSKISFQTLATLPFSAYPEKLRIRAAVAAFGADIAKEIFPDKIAEIDSVDTKPLSSDEKAIAQQMKNLKQRIEESRFLESDDQNLLDVLTKTNDGEVDEDLLKYINLEDLNRILTGEEIGSIRELLKRATEIKSLSENSTTMQQAIANLKEIFENIQKRYTSQQEYIQKQELIRKINAVNLSFFDSKLLADIREESREKFDEIKRRFEGKNLESLSLKDLEDYWNLKKELLTIFEPKDEDGVKSVLEEVFADIEVFISFIGNSAPKGDYAKIALSFSAAFAAELNKRLGRSRLGIISSTTTDEGSIDAISTIVAQMYDALMVYVTAIDYLKYVDPKKYPGSKDFEEMQRLVGGIDKEELIRNGTNLEDFLTAFKFVAENGDIYSKSVARANNTDSSNIAVIIGGGNVAIKEDLKNAIEEKNEIFLINSITLAKQSQAPAMDHKKLMDLNSQYAVSNAVQYILNILDLFNKKAFSLDKDGHIIDINLPELELTDKEKGIISKLEEKKKQLAELRNKNGKNKTKEIRNLEREIDEIENTLGQLKIFYYLLKEKILADREKYKDVIELTEFLLNKFLGLGKDIITKEDLSNSKLKIHVFDMGDEHSVDETVEKEEETYKNAAEKVAKTIVNFLEQHSFFKKAWTYLDVQPVDEKVLNTKIKREAFDLEYAISKGYVVADRKEEIKTAGGNTTRIVYKLKDADSSQHYSKFILSKGSDGITDKFRTDVGEYAIDPMFVIYEDGSVGFMSQQDFKNVYGEKKKENDKFEVIKEESNDIDKDGIEVCFLPPRSIIETKEGRVTVHSNEIVLKRGNSIYAMSISTFERIYPNTKPENKKFYEKYEEEINKLRAAQEKLSSKQAEISKSRISDEKGKTVTQTRKKVNIRNIIVGLLLTVTLLFSSLNITNSFSSAKAEAFDTTPVITSQEVYRSNVEYSASNIQQILSSNKQLQQLFRSLKTNNTMFAPSTKEDLKISLQASSAEEVRSFILSDIIKAASFFGLDESYDYDNVPEIIFMKTDSEDEYFLGSACAHSVLIDGEIKDFIIIPVNYDNDGRFILTREIFSTIVHEWTHVLNRDKVEAGLMSPLEDEYEATRNGYLVLGLDPTMIIKVGEAVRNKTLVLNLEEGEVTFKLDKNDEQKYTMPFEFGMRILCFSKILEEKDRAIVPFGKNVNFDDLYYGKVIPNIQLESGKRSIIIELINMKTKQKEKVYAIMDEDGILTIQKGEIELKNTEEVEYVYVDGNLNIQDQQEVTKDGKRTRTKTAKKTTKTSTEKAQQTEISSDKMTRRELLDLLETRISMKSILEKDKLMGAFVDAAAHLNVSRETFRTILLPLAERLANRKIADVSTEENYLTFKILLSEYFQKNKIKMETSTEITDYEDAMKMGRLLYYVIGDKAADLTEQQIEQILPSLMDIYYKAAKELDSRSTISAETGFYCLLGAEKECTNKGWESIFNLLGIDPQRTYFKCKGSSSTDKGIAQQWLDAIRNYPENKAKFGLKNIYVMYSGHGQPTYLSTGVYDLKVKDIVEALVDARRNGADLSEITLDLATCWSYFSSLNIIEQLKKRLEEENLPLSFPNIVTDAGFESLKGKFVDMKENSQSYSEIKASDLVGGSLNVTLSNKEVALIEYILKNKDKLNGQLSLSDFHNAERASANYTVFAVTNEKMEDLFESLRQNVFGILGITPDEITYGTEEMTITESDIYEEHFWDVHVQRWLAKEGKMIYMELLLDKTKKFLDKLGNTGIIKRIYKDKAGENFKNTRLGKAIGVNLETFAFWMPNFVAAHNFDPSQASGAKAVVWRIRALSIGIGFGIVPAIISLINPITVAVIIPAVITTLATANIFHYFYDIDVYKSSEILRMSELKQKDQNESEDKIATDNKRETIVFNKRSLRNLINSIKQKISSKKQTFADASIENAEIVDVLEQALSEIEKNPMLVSMQTETFNDINFNVCNFKSLQNFIEDSKNKALELGNAINNFLLSAILSKDNIFTVNDHGTIRNYIHDSTLSAEEKARRLEQIKVIARLYGYISFKNEFFKQNKEGILTNNSVIKIGEQELTLYQWIHICDGHSICLNGNEIGEFASSPEKYLEKSSERAFDFAIRMNRLADVPSIKENPDILVLQDSKYIYVKRNGESEKFDVVVESIFGDLVTMYTVDGDVIKTDSGKYDISKFVENFDTQKDYIDIFIGSKNSTYSLPDGCCFKKDEEGNIFQFKNNEWKKLPVDNNGLVMLSRNAVSFDRSSGINKVTGEKLILFKATKSSPIYYYNKLDTSWYEYKDNKFVKLKDLENVKKLMKSFEINGANYYFSNSMNSMHFDSNLKSIENYDLLEHLTEINDYRVYVQYIRNKRNPNKKGQTQVLIFDELTKKWHYKDLDSVRTIEDGTKTHYIISQPIGVIITLEGSVLINIRERKAEIKQITYDKNTGKKEETSYMKLDGKWYSFKKESGTNLPLYPLVDAVDFTFDDKNYLYANKTLYEIADNDTLVETEQRTAQAFDINGIKYVNFDNKLYTMEEGNLIPVTEEQADKLKSDKQYGSLFRVLFNVVNPTGLTLSLVLQIFNTNETMKGKNVIVDEDVKITKELADIAKREGINIVKLRIIKGQEARQRGGTLINEQSKIRMLFDSSKNELLVYSKQGINLDRNKIKDLIAAAYSEGRKDLELSSTDSDKKIITFMEKSDFVGNTTGTMLQEMIDRLEIARKAGIIKAETEIKFDLRGKKISEQVLKGEHDSTGANTFTLTRDQIDPLKSNEIEQIREKYRLIEFYEADNIPALIEFDGLQIDATGITTREQAIDILKKLQKMCNVEKTISIEFSKDIYIALADENIFSKYGVLPIANADTISIINGKKEVNKISANVNLERILDDDQVVGVIADSNSRDILSIIKGLLATKTSKYEKGLNVGLREVSSRDGKQEGYGCDITSERLKQILTRKKEIDIEDIPYLGLQEKDRKYLEYLLEKEKGEAKKEESFGFVVGIAMGTMKQKWMEKFTNIDDSSFIKEGKGQYEKGLLLLMLSMQVSGVSIDGLLEEVSKTEYDDKGWQMSAEEMYRIIGEKASVIISRVLNENDKEIKVLSDKELVRAKEDFRDLNILIQDRFRIVEATEEVKISALTVRSILAAA